MVIETMMMMLVLLLLLLLLLLLVLLHVNRWQEQQEGQPYSR